MRTPNLSGVVFAVGFALLGLYEGWLALCQLVEPELMGDALPLPNSLFHDETLVRPPLSTSLAWRVARFVLRFLVISVPLLVMAMGTWRRQPWMSPWPAVVIFSFVMAGRCLLA